ncbi:glycosyltransferase family 4 protein [uncultured Sphingomonas sp.]|uniref:glycosyltransferase family 4 protein n=1 Tax=uncultured Sphingomonas sp. TaxID=158754 RepID=UPI0025D50D6C|nr:glycosyltransferase family 4 protein [uncultured Sphingomonas sp.]
MPAHAALQYARSSFDTRVGDMMGRIMAGETFLRAWVRHGGADPVTAWAEDPQDAAGFRQQVAEFGGTADVAIANHADLGPLRRAGALWLADPAVAAYAWRRRWDGQRAWSLIGITHTISSDRAMDRIAELATAPVQPWDALICTSRAVRGTVQTLLAEQADYLAARLGATDRSLPELPVIPLGVDCDRFTPDPAARARWRGQFGIADDAVAILQFGRLSLHMKAHPLPLLQAVARAARRSKPRLHLIFAGQPSNPEQGKHFRDLGAAFAEHFTTHFVDGAQAEANTVRSAADIFTLLSDNIQESFGLAPVEGMAAGLPVVGSDWDGLRDTIDHGVTGFLVDSLLPAPGGGDVLARRYANGLDNYHHYLAAVAQATSVDVEQAADFFTALANNPDLRRRMGEAGARRAREHYDWPVVIGAHRDLLDHLAGIRAIAPERAPRTRTAQPARMDPYALFAGYPTQAIDADTRIAAGPSRLADLPGDKGMMVRHALAPADLLDRMIAHIGRGPLGMVDLVAAFPDQPPALLVNTVAWMLKVGLARRV